MLRRSVVMAGALLVLSSFAAIASAQGPRGGMFFGRGGGSSAMLLAMPEVQKEVGLSDDQKKQVDTLLNEAREKMRAAFGANTFQDFQNLSAEDREKRIAEMRKKFEEGAKEIDAKIGKIIDAKQAERLHQLQMQREGAMALNRPEVIQKLGLSEEQQAKIKKIQEEARPAGPRFDPNQSEEDRRAGFQKMREKFEKAQKECLAVLNDDQMLDWTSMCGKTFKFPERQGFRRGNRPAPPPEPQQ